MHASLSHERGFALLEALVASAVLIAGIAAVVHLLVLAAVSTRAAGDMTEAVVLAAQKAEELRAEAWEHLADGEDRRDRFVRMWLVRPLPGDDTETVSIVIVVRRSSGSTVPRAGLALLRARRTP